MPKIIYSHFKMQNFLKAVPAKIVLDDMIKKGRI
jgi:hypothetical protein